MIIRSETPHEIVTWFCYLDFDCHCCCVSDAHTVAEISDRGCAQKSRRQAKSRGSSAANCRWQAGSSGSPLVDLKISTFDQEAMRPEVVNPSRFVLIAKENGKRHHDQSREQLDARENARRHGQGRHGHGDNVDHDAGSVVRQCRRVVQAVARVQRILRKNH